PHCRHLYYSTLRRAPISTLFPYTTLFRSDYQRDDREREEQLLERRIGALVHPGEAGAETEREQRGPGRVFNGGEEQPKGLGAEIDRKSTRLNSSHQIISYAVFCLKKKKKN